MNITISCKGKLVASVIRKLEQRGFRRATVDTDLERGTYFLRFHQDGPAIKQIREMFRSLRVRKNGGFVNVA